MIYCVISIEFKVVAKKLGPDLDMEIDNETGFRFAFKFRLTLT